VLQPYEAIAVLQPYEAMLWRRLTMLIAGARIGMAAKSHS